MRLIISEKPFISKLLCESEALLDTWPNEEILVIHTYSFCGFKFKYPNDLKYSDFPLVKSPEYKVSLHMELFSDRKDAMTSGFYVKNSQSYKESKFLTVDEVRHVVQNAEHIVYAGDPDPTGMFAFHLYLKMFAPHRLDENHGALYIAFGLSTEWMKRYCAEVVTTADPRMVNFLERGKVKKYFDYNFNLNAMAILNASFKDAFGTEVDMQMSKYELQTLYYVSRMQNQSTDHVKLMTNMEKWSGTGKYNPRNSWTRRMELGSPASRSSIIKNLINIGALEDAGQSGDYRVHVTKAGKAFLENLHPDTLDLDLPYRIDQWQTEGLDVAKPKIDRYIRTFFGKQKRFSEKRKHTDA